jgi:hypothetical protein
MRLRLAKSQRGPQSAQGQAQCVKANAAPEENKSVL